MGDSETVVPDAVEDPDEQPRKAHASMIFFPWKFYHPAVGAPAIFANAAAPQASSILGAAVPPIIT